MCIACCVTKGIKAHSEYLVFIAFALKQWLHVSASLLYFSYFIVLLILVLQSETSDGAIAFLVISNHVTVFGEHKVAAINKLRLLSFIFENTDKFK
jgi:hypothetical protein